MVVKLSQLGSSVLSFWHSAQAKLPSVSKMQRLAQYTLMVVSSYEATKSFEHDEEFSLPLILSGALMGVALTGEILKRGRRFDWIADPKKLCVLSIMGIGAALLSANSTPAMYPEATQKALDIFEMEKDIFFRKGVQCEEDLYLNRDLFTRQGCVVCVDDEFSLIFGAREIYQRRFDFDVNELICVPPIPYFQELWPFLTNLTLNTTDGRWPCGAPKIERPDATREILQHFAKLHAPMSVTLLPVNESCYQVIGQGTRSLHMTTLCIRPFLLDRLYPQVTGCVTDAFREYMIEYSSDFSFPKVVFD